MRCLPAGMGSAPSSVTLSVPAGKLRIQPVSIAKGARGYGSGGCNAGRFSGESLILKGMVAELDGSRIIRDEVRGHEDSPEEMGVSLARRLLSSGAAEILARIYESV